MSSVSRGAEEFLALSDAMNNETPKCSGDWRYIQDREALGPDDVTAMRRVCQDCPLQSLCRKYGDAARPSAGMWAGRFWGRRERANRSGKEDA